MYRCKDCGLIFEEPKLCKEDRTPGGSFEGGSFIEEFEGCPKCEGSFEKVDFYEEYNEYLTKEERKSRGED